jgi:hypothetical protein
MVCVLLLGCQEKAEFRVHQPVGGGYSVEFPAKARETKIVAQSEYGPVDVSISAAALNQAIYSVTFLDYPDAALTSVQEIYDLAVVDAASDLSGKVESHTELAGSPVGRAYRILFGRARVALGRLYLRGTRLYRVQFAGPISEEDSASVRRFFDSLRLRSGPVAGAFWQSHGAPSTVLALAPRKHFPRKIPRSEYLFAGFRPTM